MRTSTETALKICRLLCTLLLVGVCSCIAQSTYSHVLVDTIARLEAPSWQDRSIAFRQLISIGLEHDPDSEFPVPDGVLNLTKKPGVGSESVRRALIALLEKENSAIQELPNGLDTEAYSNYYADVIGAVSTLRDRRSARALLGAINTGNMALTALAGFGESTLNPVLAMLPAADEETRHSSIALLSRMCERRNIAALNTESRDRLKRTLVEAAFDTSIPIRQRAVEGLGHLGDVDVKPILAEVARTYSGSGVPQENALGLAAAKALKQSETRVVNNQ